MKLTAECIPCFYKQTMIVANLLKLDNSKKIKLLKGISKVLYENVDENITPAKVATHVHSYINESLGVADPFASIKKMSNDKILSFYKDFSLMIEKSGDPLKLAVTFAIIGNFIDYSLFENVNLDKIKEKIDNFNPAIFDYDQFKNDVKNANRILYLVDNAGEVVFDKLLIEIFFKMKKKVIIVAKEKPILNDATVDDVNYVSISKLGKVFGLGNGDVGTPFPSKSDFFNKAFKTADLIISKGQANFETLNDANGCIYFLFVTKCKAVADFLKVPENSPVLLKK